MMRSAAGSARRPLLLIAILTLALLLSGSQPALAHGPSEYLAVNASTSDTYQELPNPVCHMSHQHGNYFVAYSKTKREASSFGCNWVGSYVTGCSGLDCPTSGIVYTVNVGQWYQAQLGAGYSIIHSHRYTGYESGNISTIHACVFC